MLKRTLTEKRKEEELEGRMGWGGVGGLKSLKTLDGLYHSGCEY